ncbi:PREDICTED: peptide-N4-(N-acetyl-beta-glucosaminyl)asparagine amidase A-like [Nelumbo nucifera]|uniref:Peptide-N4-(N-acetyl-beta- glucosaminyl)asparagine amidase A-like n=1 Tax=Nelumbo nucifera TaxID=4432 RepID=A0A1U8A6U4_NELNU|nr:PREDICTED: peptide-N4-(N-acetyl-beta-glucosaminyl)asparagine amidase A-like [Nelumbo nucifera]
MEFRSLVHCLFCFSLILFLPFASSSSFPDRYLKSIPPSLRLNASDEYIELTKPLPSDELTPSCSLLLLQEDFGHTIGLPPVSVPYSPPPDCSGPWTHVVLEFLASCQGEQYDRIVGVWLDGVEILRTSTAEPTESGIFWKVRKDVTRYSSLFSQSNLTLSVMLENVVNDVFTGIYHVNISLLYYGENKIAISPLLEDQKYNRKLGFAIQPIRNNLERIMLPYDYEAKKLGFISKDPSGKKWGLQESQLSDEKPADLIIPVSGDGDDGFWFRIQNEADVHSTEIQIPLNTYRAVLEIYVSFHGNDEFWYSNPPDSYIKLNNLTTGRGNGAFRQVFVTIDGVFVGSEVPFPVIFTGGINPLFWEPVVAIGAFNLPSYDLDLTPFLGLLLDGNSHSFGLGVTDGIPFWLVDANLHLWLDPGTSVVQAKSVRYHVPPLSVERHSKFKQLDGLFKIEVERKMKFSGWVNGSAGNFTTHVTKEMEFKNSIKFKKNGMSKEVKQKIKAKTEVRVESDAQELLARTIFKRKYPLEITTSTLPGPDDNTSLSITNISHSLNDISSRGNFSTSVSNSQESGGWMVVQDHSVLSGSANTRQTLTYIDDYGCFSRTVAASNGKLLEDNSTAACAQPL